MPKPMLVPSEDHPIDVARNPNRVVVRASGRVIADSRSALTLREAGYAPVQYIPRDDVDMSLLARSDHASYCPYKGDAGYFHLRFLGEEGANAAWTYEAPHPAVVGIAGRIAFYPSKVTITEEPLQETGAVPVDGLNG